MIDAGLEVADELVRLEVLADDLDLGAVRGLDVEFTDVEIRRETPRPGLAHLYVEQGVVATSVDVADLPLGPLVLDRAPEDFLTHLDREVTPLRPASNPIVAVQVDGRWYLSHWYSIAENARLVADLPLPDSGRRPASIGAETPAEAVSGLFDELLRLDVQRMIGMLDPVEAAALYDYAPLFLDDVTANANDLLDSLGDDGWVWAIEELSLSSVADGDRARVTIERVEFGAANDAGHTLDVEFSPDHVRFALNSADFWGEPYSVEWESAGECFTMTYEDSVDGGTEEVCGEDLVGPLPAGLTGTFADSTSTTSVTLSLHRVDGRWFISPTDTVADLVIDALRELEPDGVADLVDSFSELVASPGSSWGRTLGRDAGSVFLDSGDDAASPEFLDAENLDLLVDTNGLQFATDDDFGIEAGWWLPELDVAVGRGVYGTFTTGSGDASVVVYEMAPLQTTLGDAFGDLAPPVDLGLQEEVVFTPGPIDKGVLVAVSGSRLTFVGSWGADLADMESLLLAQLG